MRVTFFVGVLMMDAMRSNPSYWPAFESERAAHRQEIFDSFGRLVPSMSEQTVVAHADAQAAGDPPQHDGSYQSLPREEKQRRDRADVKHSHEGGGQVNPLGERFVAREELHDCRDPCERADRNLCSHLIGR